MYPDGASSLKPATHLVKNSTTFQQLLAGVDGAEILRGHDVSIGSVAYDSRKVETDGLFVALRGAYVDGHNYLGAALAHGAVACLIDHDPTTVDIDGFAAVGKVPDCRAALPVVACNYFDHPSRELQLVGVTGTDGKTTTSHMLEHILTTAGKRVGLIGTVATQIPGRAAMSSGRQTTPESLDTQRLLAEMRIAGADTVILETSSHGLETHRVDGCIFDIGVVTNITHEHIDFHGTVEAYRRAKARLFDGVALSRDDGGAGIGIVNVDDAGARTVLPHTTGLRLLTFGMSGEFAADVTATGVEPDSGGYRFVITTPAGSIATSIPMIGRWNVSNALAATAVGISLGLPLETISEGLRTLPPVPGRMAHIRSGQPFQLIVDYAHTAPALRALLDAARETTEGRVMVLFGSAGERDIEKRSEMGAVAAELADYVVISSEDPRFEDPHAIIDQIATGAVRAGAREGVDFVRLEDRASAIEHIVERAVAGDTVILAGKGHESSMIYGANERPWDEAGVAREVLNSMGYAED